MLLCPTDMHLTFITRESHTHRIRLGLADCLLADLMGFRDLVLLFQCCFAAAGGPWLAASWLRGWFMKLHWQLEVERELLPYRYGVEGDFGGGETVTIDGEMWVLSTGHGECSLSQAVAYVGGSEPNPSAQGSRLTKWIDLRGKRELAVDGGGSSFSGGSTLTAGTRNSHASFNSSNPFHPGPRSALRKKRSDCRMLEQQHGVVVALGRPRGAGIEQLGRPGPPRPVPLAHREVFGRPVTRLIDPLGAARLVQGPRLVVHAKASAAPGSFPNPPCRSCRPPSRTRRPRHLRSRPCTCRRELRTCLN